MYNESEERLVCSFNLWMAKHLVYSQMGKEINKIVHEYQAIREAIIRLKQEK